MEITELASRLNPNRSEPPQANDALGQEEFFDLMIAQLQNQDPTSPQDSAEMFNQLSGFATVGGIKELQQTVQSLVDSLSSSQALGASSLIDREVLVSSESGWLGENTPLRGSVALPFAADSLTVRVVDTAGAVVRELDLGRQNGGEVKFEWDGLDDRGNPMAAGRYGIEVDAQVGGSSMALPALIAARVERVALGGLGGDTMLTLAGLGQVSLRDVQEIGTTPEDN